uniref:Uncharacterized protein n=1 Tax=Knipowitschia caucasica TaxID=637954 RepID=A0AAV2J1T7_KNICA
MVHKSAGVRTTSPLYWGDVLPSTAVTNPEKLELQEVVSPGRPTRAKPGREQETEGWRRRSLGVVGAAERKRERKRRVAPPSRADISADSGLSLCCETVSLILLCVVLWGHNISNPKGRCCGGQHKRNGT